MNTRVLVSLERIMANPWQPRISEDSGHVRGIAESIVQNDLLQAPTGRVVVPGMGGLVRAQGQPDNLAEVLEDTESAVVQLAFGHSRLAAFRLIRRIETALRGGKAVDNDLLADDYQALVVAVDKAIDWGRSFGEMEVRLADLPDEQMFEQGISENIQRKSLSPIEEALAMKRYQEDFHKNSVQIGRLFGIGDSAVRNKMRLLNLPAQLQVELGRGVLSEGLARSLLALYDLPAEVRVGEQAEIERLALMGEITPAGVYERVEIIRERMAPKMQLMAPAPVQAEEPEWEEQDPDGPDNDGPEEVAVSVETVVQPAPVEKGELVKQVQEHIQAMQRPSPSPLPEERGEAAQQPAGQTAQAEALPWEKAQVILTVTYMAANGAGPDVRPCVVSVRAGNEMPQMRFTSSQEIVLSGLMADLLEQVRSQYQAAHS